MYYDSMKALFMLSFVECENVRASYIVCVHAKVRARARSVSLTLSLPSSRSLSLSHTHLHAHTHTSTHACMHASCVHTNAYHINTRARMHTHTHANTYANACPYKCTPHKHTRARMQACSCADPTPHRIVYTNAFLVIALNHSFFFPNMFICGPYTISI